MKTTCRSFWAATVIGILAWLLLANSPMQAQELNAKWRNELTKVSNQLAISFTCLPKQPENALDESPEGVLCTLHTVVAAALISESGGWNVPGKWEEVDGTFYGEVEFNWKLHASRELARVRGSLKLTPDGVWEYTLSKADGAAEMPFYFQIGQKVLITYNDYRTLPPLVSGTDTQGPVTDKNSSERFWNIGDEKVAVTVTKHNVGKLDKNHDWKEFEAYAQNRPKNSDLHVLTAPNLRLLLEKGDAWLFRIATTLGASMFVWVVRDQNGFWATDQDDRQWTRLNPGVQIGFQGSVSGVDWSLKLVRPTQNQDEQGREVDYLLTVK